MISDWLKVLLFSTTIIFILKYLWSRRKLYYISYKLPGPVGLPIIGNGLLFMCHNSEILDRLSKLLKSFDSPTRFWLGPKFLVAFNKPKHLEKIMTSSKLAYKHEIYEFIKPLLGTGLISDSGPVYRIHKKLIQPIYNNEFVVNSVPVFQQHLTVLMDVLEKRVQKGCFNIEKDIHLCFADICGRLMFGASLNCQYGGNKDFIHAITDVYDVLYTRIMKPWLHSNFIFNLTPYSVKLKKCRDVLHNLIENHIRTAFTEGKPLNVKENFTASVDHLVELFKMHPGVITYQDLIYHLLTLYAASEDTMTAATSFACVCFGMNPIYQQRAAEEVREVIGDEQQEITYDDLAKLKYVEMCLKDVLRLFPIAPYILRRTTEDTEIDDIIYPEGCAILVDIFNLHRNPLFWEKPLDFYPEHFTSEAVAQRPAYTYLPFSSGTRGCIGKPLAYTGLKLALAYILQRFTIEADGKVSDIPLMADISVRPINGYNVKLKRRIWK